ncbi:MAG: MFS transporter [Cyclobacteriaceae bacterium]
MFHHLVHFIRDLDTRTTGMLFALNSFAFGNWVTRIPDIKYALDLSDAELGLALLGAPIGSVLTMPFTNWISSKLKLGRATLIFAVLYSMNLIFLPLASSQWILFGALFVFGATMAVMDVGMNAIAVLVERNHKKHIMSTCHGMWSLGAMIGSAFGSLILSLEWQVYHHMLVTTGFLLFILLLIMPKVLNFQDESGSKQHFFTFPNGTILILSLIGFFILLSEGAIADWSAVYMREVLSSDVIWIGMAFSGYAGFMAIGRFGGDFIIPKMGKKFVVVTGGILSGITLAIALISANTAITLIGFSLVGLGFSCIVPVIFSAAANEPGFNPASGIAAVSMFGYTGFLAGPPIIGFISDSYGLTSALLMVAGLSLLVALIGAAIKFR